MPATAFTRVHPVNPKTGKLFVHFGQDLPREETRGVCEQDDAGQDRRICFR